VEIRINFWSCACFRWFGYTQTSEAKISFKPYHEYNYLPASFGLQAVKVVPSVEL